MLEIFTKFFDGVPEYLILHDFTQFCFNQSKNYNFFNFLRAFKQNLKIETNIIVCLNSFNLRSFQRQNEKLFIISFV